jgi:Uma2 family endonuclease
MNDQFLTPAQPVRYADASQAQELLREPPEAYPTAPQPAVDYDVLWTRLETEPVLRQWSREEYYRMGEAGVLAPDERVELIEGVIFQMPPQGPIHSTGTRGAQEALRTAFGPGFDMRPQLPLSLGLASDPEPDIAVVPGSFRDYRVAHPTTALLVVEVSDTTLNFDRSEKASLYARAGIQDYWIINIPEQVLEVYRDPQPDPTKPFQYGYANVMCLRIGDTIAPLAAPKAVIQVSDLLP